VVFFFWGGGGGGGGGLGLGFKVLLIRFCVSEYRGFSCEGVSGFFVWVSFVLWSCALRVLLVISSG